MKTQESGMSSEGVWDGFFNPQAILEGRNLTSPCGNLLEFGCGYGTFTIAAAGIISGTVYALASPKQGPKIHVFGK